jgi:hypothetical protein
VWPLASCAALMPAAAKIEYGHVYGYRLAVM